MRLIAAALLGLVLASIAPGSTGKRIISSHGVRVVVPEGWQLVRSASSGSVTDPRTLLVVGTAGVRPKTSRCQIAAYRIPAAGAVVVVVGWKSEASAGGGPWKPGRGPLRKLVAVHKPSFECFSGRGAVADVLLGGKPFQVNVLVGANTSKLRIAEALRIGRSFDLAR